MNTTNFAIQISDLPEDINYLENIKKQSGNLEIIQFTQEELSHNENIDERKKEILKKIDRFSQVYIIDQTHQGKKTYKDLANTLTNILSKNEGIHDAESGLVFEISTSNMARMFKQALQNEGITSTIRTPISGSLEGEQLFIQRLEELLTAADQAGSSRSKDLLKQDVPLLMKALKFDQEIDQRLQQVAEEKFSLPSQQCRQLRDMQLYLNLLVHHVESAENFKKEEKETLAFLIQEIDKAHTSFSQAVVPQWSSHLDQIEQLIKSELPGQRTFTTPSILNVKTAPISARTFSAILLESMIQDSELEGNLVSTVLNYLDDYLETNQKNYQNILEFPKLLCMIKDAHSYGLNMDHVVNLKVGDKTLVPIGWTGSPRGHSMEMGIERESDGSLRILIYNLGEGCQYHASLEENGKQLYQPFVEIKGVSEARLLDPDLLQSLVELDTYAAYPDNSQKKTEYGASDIYSLLLNSLGGTLIPCRGTRETFMRPQMSGTCTWSSLQAVFHTELPLPAYSKIITDISLDSLCGYYQSVKKNLVEDETSRNMLHHASVYCAQVALDAYRNHGISLEELKTVHSTLKELQQIVDSLSAQAMYKNIPEKPLTFEPLESAQVLSCIAAASTRESSAITEVSSPGQISSFIPFSFDWMESPDQIEMGLSSLVHHIFDTVKQHNAVEGVRCLEQFFALEAKKEIKVWEQIPAAQRSAVITQLANLTELLFQACATFPHKIREYTTYAYYLAAINFTLAAHDPEMRNYFKTNILMHEKYANAATGSSWSGTSLEDHNLYRPQDRILCQRALDILNTQRIDATDDSLVLEHKKGLQEIAVPEKSKIHQESPLVQYLSQHLSPESIEKFKQHYPEYANKQEEFFILLALCDWNAVGMSPLFSSFLRQQHVLNALDEGLIYPIGEEGKSVFQSIVKGDPSNPDKFFHGFLTAPQKIEVVPQRDSSQKKYFAELIKIREKQNKGDGDVIAFTSESDVMVKPLKEWEKNLELILAQGDMNNGDHFYEQQVIKTLTYFSQHLGKLVDPDMRALCLFLIFEGNYLETLLEKSPPTARLVMEFVQKGYRYFAEGGKIAGASYFLDMGRRLEELLSKHNLTVFPSIRDSCTQLLSRPNLSQEERTLIYQQIAASYDTHPPTDFNEKEATLLITALLHHNTHPVTEHGKTELDNEISAVAWNYQSRIEQHLKGQSGPAICRAITQTFDPSSSSLQWNCRDRYPLCSNEEGYAIHAGTFTLYIKNMPLTVLPISVLTDQEFSRVFPKKDYVCRALGLNRYEFEEENGTTTRVQIKEKGGVLVEQLIDGHWHQLTSLKALVSDKLVISHPFQELCSSSSLWIAVEPGSPSQEVIIRNASHQITHRLSMRTLPSDQVKIEKVSKETLSGTSLSLIDIETTKDPQLQKLFKDGFIWKEEGGTLKQAELPALGLSFEMKKEGKIWRAYSEQHSGFFISPTQRYRDLQSIPGAIVLENQAGMRKLVAPYGTIVYTGKGSFKSGLSVHPSPEEEMRTISFDLSRTSKPIATSRQQQLYLAGLFLGQRAYKQAQELIRHSFSHVLPYTQKELELLDQLSHFVKETRDPSPQAAALTCTIFAQFPSSYKLNLDKEKLGDQEKLIADKFWGYKNTESLIPNLELTTEEIKQIDENWVRTLVVTPPLEVLSLGSPLEGDLSLSEDTLALNTETIAHGLNNPLPVVQLLTRPKGEFLHDFFDLYSLALHDPFKLKQRLATASNQEEQYVPKNLLLLLRSIADYREVKDKKIIPGFPPPENDFKTIIQKKNEAALSTLLQQAAEVQDLLRKKRKEENINSIFTLTGERPSSYTRTKEMQEIAQRKELPLNEPPVKVPPRATLETGTKIEAFHESPSLALSLKDQELSALQQAIMGTDQKDSASLEAQDRAEHIAAYWSQPQQAATWKMVDRNKIEKLSTLLLVQHAEMGKTVRLLEQELLAFANQLPVDAQDALLLETEKIGNLRQPISLREILIFTARSAHFTLKGKNPELARQEDVLRHKSILYLEMKAQHQQLARALDLLSQLDPQNEAGYANLSEKCYQELTRKPPYKAEEYPEFLVFEVLEEKGIYEWQVEDLKRLFRPETGTNPNLILEKVMGSGKTKFYLPLLALNKADGEHLALIVIHSSQYETVAESMDIGSQQHFGQVAHTLQFSRDNDTSLKALQKILEEFRSVQHKHHFLVVTDKSLHSLYLAFRELSDQYVRNEKEDPDLAARLGVMREIFALLKTKGKATFDETDLLLNYRYEVVYSLGKPQPIEKAHADLVADLYRSIAPFLTALIPFTQADYLAIKGKMIETFAQEMASKMGLETGRVIAYLNGEEQGMVYWGGLEEQQKNLLAIAFYEFKELLPTTLDRRCGEHFGYSADPNKILPVPYIASGVPSPTAEFSFPYVLMNYTIQTLEAQGISHSLLKTLIHGMQMRVLKEQKANPDRPLEDTKGYRDFEALCADVKLPQLAHSFLYITPHEIEKLVHACQKNPPDLYAFAKKHLFPSVTLYPRKLASTPFSLAELFQEVQGFTGTPWNHKTFPNQLETSRDKLSAGKTEGIMWKNSQVVHTLKSSHFEKTIEEIATIQEKGSYRAFIDVGAMFNGCNNRTVAEALLKKLPATVKGILYFEGNTPSVLRRGKSQPERFNQEEGTQDLYIFYDQYHTTGTDYRIPGRSLLSVGKNSKMRDLEQGYMRDRRAAEGQRVEWILSPEAEHFIKKELTLSGESPVKCANILRCAELNQERELKELLLMSSFEGIKGVVNRHIDHLLLDSKIPLSQIWKKGEKIRHLIGESLRDSPHQDLGSEKKERKTEEFFNALIDQTVESLSEVLEDPELFPAGFDATALKEELRACVNFEELPPTISSTAAHTPEQFVEQQAQQERLAMVHKEVLSDKSSRLGGPIHWNFDEKARADLRQFYRTVTPEDLKKEALPVLKLDSYVDAYPVSESQAPFLSLSAIFAAEPSLQEFADIFDLEASYNFLPVEAHIRQGKAFAHTHIKPFEKGQLDVNYLLICKDQDSNDAHVRLLSQADGGFFLHSLEKCRRLAQEQPKPVVEKSKPPTLPDSLDFVTQFLGFGQLKLEKQIMEATPSSEKVDEMKKQVHIKFFYGSNDYTSEEKEYLKKWMEQRVDPVSNNRAETFKGLLIEKRNKSIEAERLEREKEIEEKMKGNQKPELEVSLYHMTLKTIQSTDEQILAGKKEIIDHPIVLKKLVQAKFFNGESFYTEREMAYLREWIKEKGTDRMKRLFEEHILPNKQEKRQEYVESPLLLLFQT